MSTYQETSREAHEAIKPEKPTLKQRVLTYIVSQGDYGAIDEEVQRALGMIGSTQRPRRGELQAEGLIVDSGRRRKTLTNRAAIVWVAAKKRTDRETQSTLF